MILHFSTLTTTPQRLLPPPPYHTRLILKESRNGSSQLLNILKISMLSIKKNNCNIYTSKNTTKIWICEIDIRIRKTRNTWRLSWFRNETFIYLFEFKVFRHEGRDTQFLSILIFPSNPTTCATPPQTTGLASASSENQLPSSSVESQLTVFFFFSNPKILSPSLTGMTSFTSPVLFPIWFFYSDICDCHIHPARAWTPALNVCT